MEEYDVKLENITNELRYTVLLIKSLQNFRQTFSIENKIFFEYK